jgi:hypothetical protein
MSTVRRALGHDDIRRRTRHDALRVTAPRDIWRMGKEDRRVG